MGNRRKRRLVPRDVMSPNDGKPDSEKVNLKALKKFRLCLLALGCKMVIRAGVENKTRAAKEAPNEDIAIWLMPWQAGAGQRFD